MLILFFEYVIDNEVASDNEAESDGEAVDEEDPRNKRFLNFNLGASGDAAGGSGGGSGNFLFDIIRVSCISQILFEIITIIFIYLCF